MKLYNRTKLSDTVLTKLLVCAGRAVGARTQGVVVQVNRGLSTHGTAYRCSAIKLRGNRWNKTDGGYFKICYSTRYPSVPIESARAFFDTARHEWAHIRDYQNPGAEFSKRTRGRRPVHDSRPEEIRAYDAVWDSDHKNRPGYFDNVIIALAVELERTKSC